MRSISLGVIFLSLILGAALAEVISIAVPLWYSVISAITLWLYARDKSAAKKGARRILENNLHLVALLGGWPGALFGQQWLRHKTVKARFRIVFWTTVLINSAACFYVFAAGGELHAPYWL